MHSLQVERQAQALRQQLGLAKVRMQARPAVLLRVLREAQRLRRPGQLLQGQRPAQQLVATHRSMERKQAPDQRARLRRRRCEGREEKGVSLTDPTVGP